MNEPIVAHQNLMARARNKRYWPIGMTFGVGLVLSVASFAIVRRWERQRADVDFERRTANLTTFLQTDAVQMFTDRQLTALTRMSGAWGIAEKRDSAAWAQFSSYTMGSDWIKVSSMWIPRVSAAGRQSFEREAKSQLKGGFYIWDWDASRSTMIPAPQRDEYYPIYLAQEAPGNEVDVGLDLATDSLVAAALERARDTGLTVAVGRVPLFGNQASSIDFTHIKPVYDGGQNGRTVEERREKLLGYAALVTRTSIAGLAQLFPMAMGGVDILLVELPPRSRDAAGAEGAPDFPAAETGLRKGARLDIAHRPWALLSRPRPEFVVAQHTWQPWWAMAGVLLLTTLAAAYMWRSLHRAEQIEQLIAQSTENLSKANAELEAEIAVRYLAEEERRQSEEKYRALLENIEDGFFEVDLRGNFTFFNSAMRRFLGYESEAMMGMNYRRYMDEENIRRVFECFNKLFRTGTPERGFAYELIAKDGTRRIVDSSVSLVRDRNGTPIGFQGVARDITERKKAESEKAKLELQLRHAQKMEAIGTLAGGVAHDFNNLLAGILGYSSMLRASALPGDSVAKAAEVIEKAAQRASQLTQQLLGFARKGKLQNAPVDLHATIQEVASLLSRTIDKNISMIQRLRAQKALVLGDPAQLQQVILNLAVNARDAMPSGGNLVFETDVIELDSRTSTRFDDLPAGRYVLLSVSDNGCGIPKDVQDRVFEPFFTTKEQGKGTGMGLAMVYGIVKNHGGTVALYSEVGTGTRFQIYLPLALDCRLPPSPADTGAPIPGTGRILVVDDEEVVREMATDLLKALGYEVVAVCDGVEAVEYYKAHGDGVALAVIDMIMPRMGGRDCFRALKEMNPEIRAILSTGYSRDGAAQEILNEGMLGFAQKPYRMRQLSEVVATAMTGSFNGHPKSGTGELQETQMN